MWSWHAFPNKALNGWLCGLLWSCSSALISFNPHCCSCYGPFGNTHTHTCATAFVYKKQCVLCKYRSTQSLLHIQSSYSGFVSADDTSAAQMCRSALEVPLSSGCFAFSLWNMWGVPVGRPSGCISLCHGDVFASAPRRLAPRVLGMNVSMLIQGRCSVLNQVVRGNSVPRRRETLAPPWVTKTSQLNPLCSQSSHIWHEG